MSRSPPLLLLRRGRLEGGEAPLELGKNVGDGDLAGHTIPVDPSGQILPLVIVDAQDGVAAPILAEAPRRLEIVQRIDENGDEGTCRLGNSWIAERTAREVTAARSAGVLAEVEPHRFAAPHRDRSRRVVVAIPRDRPDRDVGLGVDVGIGSRSELGKRRTRVAA